MRKYIKPPQVITAKPIVKRHVVHTPHATECPTCRTLGFTLRRSSTVDHEGERRMNGGAFYACDGGCGTTLNRNCDHFTLPT